mgnify:CR=1 FL=1
MADIIRASDGRAVPRDLPQWNHAFMLAALGVMIASGHLMPTIKLAVLVVIILYGVDFMEDRIKVLGRGVHASVKSSLSKKS